MKKQVKEKKGIKQKIKDFGKDLFSKFFGFEQGIDITDDVAVLHRRNVVIKNIIFLSNLVYSTLLFILSLSTGHKTDWAITVVAFPVTYVVNRLLKTLINLDKEDKTKQLIATYVASFYIFLSSVLVYARLYKSGSFETVAYVLIYYAIVVISLYQDKKILATSFSYILIFMTSIHLIWTYQFLEISQGKTVTEFLKSFVGTNDFGDLILRTLIFILFFLVVYAIVSIGQYMQEERKLELVKRRKVQTDFSQIVGSLFQAVFINSYIYVNPEHAHQVQKMSVKVSEFVGMNSVDIKNLSDFALIHLKYDELKDLDLAGSSYDDKSYELLKTKTKLGSEIIKRIEISQNCEAIVRAHIEDTITDSKMSGIMEAQKEISSQIILLSDIYITLRSATSYKRPLPHKDSMKLFEDKMSPFFNEVLRERFIKFSDEVAEIYNNF